MGTGIIIESNKAFHAIGAKARLSMNADVGIIYTAYK